MTTETATLPVDETRFTALVEMRQRATEALARFNAANEDAKAKKKTYEAARETFEREFDRLVRSAKGEDLPLFNQSDAIARAEADPIVRKLAERLIERGHDVNALVVFGYTEDERNQVAAYLDALDEHAKLEASGDKTRVDFTVPAFLTPEPLTTVEIADLLGRLKTAGCETTAEVVQGFTLAQRAEADAWIAAVAAVTKEKGEAVTADDLPAMPEWLAEDSADTEAEAQDDEDEQAGDAGGDGARA